MRNHRILKAMKTPTKSTIVFNAASGLAVLFNSAWCTLHGFGWDIKQLGGNIGHSAR